MKKDKKINEIKKLEAKRKKVGLTKTEEKIYCKLNSELTGYPEKVFTKKYQNKLDDVIIKTDKFLNSLKK